MLINLQPVFSILFAETPKEDATTTVKKARAGDKPEVLLRKLLGDNHNETQRERLKEYLGKLGNEALFNSIFPGETFNADAKEDPEIFHNKALDAFIQLEDKLKYLNVDCTDRGKCKASPAFKQYLNMAKAMDFVFTVIEGNSALQDMALEHAYKMLVLFPPPKERTFEIFDACFRAAFKAPQNISLTQTHQPLHDLFLGALPVGIKHLAMWRELTTKNPDAMPAIIKNMGSSPGIEKLWEKDGSPKMTVNLFNNYLSRVTFVRYDEAPELAEFLSKLRIKDENIFNRILDLVKQKKLHFREGSKLLFADKKEDKIPDVTISAADLKLRISDPETGLPIPHPTTAGYYWTKLPNGDPRALILGRLTGCCQLITGDSEKCVLDGMNLATSGFYVLLKVNNPEEFDSKKFKDPDWWQELESHAEIKAQSYVWRSAQGNLVMDSLEGFSKKLPGGGIIKSKDALSDEAMLALLKQFGTKLESAGIERLSIGVGGETPGFLKSEYSKFPERMQEGTQYGDSLSQAVITESPKLIEARKALSAKFPNFNMKVFASTQQITMFDQLPQAQIDKLNALYEDEFKVYAGIAYSYHDPQQFSDTVARLFELKQTNVAKYLALTYEEALETYQTGRVVVDDLINLDTPKIELLTSHDARKAYKHGREIIATVNSLKDLTIEEINRLISGAVTAVYDTWEVTVEDLKELLGDEARFAIFTSALAVKAFESDLGNFDFKGLAAKDIPTICATLCEMASIKASPADFAGADIEKIKLLTSHEMRRILKTGPVSLADLKDLNADVIVALISAEAQIVYRTGKGSLSDLKDLTVAEIQLLTSDRVRTIYQTGLVTVKDLKGLLNDKVKLELFTSRLALQVFGLCSPFNFKEFAAGDIPTICAAFFGILKIKSSPADFTGANRAQIEVLTSDQALSAYKTGLVTPADLSGLTVEVMRELISDRALRVYRRRVYGFRQHTEVPLVSIADFKDVNDVNLIRRLLSDEALVCYKPPHFTAAHLKVLAPEVIEEVLSIYETARPVLEYVSGADLKGLNIEVVRALISPGALEAYKTGRVTPEDLKDHNVDAIKLLISYAGRDFFKMCCQRKIKIKSSDFKGINDIEVIEKIFSALAAYESGRITVSDLKSLLVKGETDKFELLTSRFAQKALKQSRPDFNFNDLANENIFIITVKLLKMIGIEASPDDFAGADLLDIKNLTYPPALQCYQTGKVRVADLKDFTHNSKHYISITSEVAQVFYKFGQAKVADVKDFNFADKEKCNALTSEGCLKAFKTGKIKFTDLKDLAVADIREIVSSTENIDKFCAQNLLHIKAGFLIVVIRVSRPKQKKLKPNPTRQSGKPRKSMLIQ